MCTYTIYTLDSLSLYNDAWLSNYYLSLVHTYNYFCICAGWSLCRRCVLNIADFCLTEHYNNNARNKLHILYTHIICMYTNTEMIKYGKVNR